MKRIGLTAMVIGAIASVALLFHVGMHGGSNRSQPVVMVLIGIWVLSPFVLLFAANAIAPSRALYVVMIVIAVLSIAVYLWAATGPGRPKPAAPFVGIPPLSWLLIAVAFVAGRRRA